MFVIIAGGGRTGAQLALTLLAENHKVHLIENRREVLSRIHRELPTEVIFEGNPVNPLSLEQAGIENAQVLAACTTSDEQNLALCYFARTAYNVHRTIARVNNPRNVWLFDEKFHVDAAVNQADIMARLIEEEMSIGDMMVLLKLRRGNYSLVEESIETGSKAIGIAIKDLRLPEHCVIAAIIRHGEVIVPRGITTFEAGDEVLAVTDQEGTEELEAFLSP
ncbi:MAG: TrkA family potassium uptake protein [Chloroflexi bacterium]|nr:TrkA family potassium uptake protein [Chloroflexota bacterium]